MPFNWNARAIAVAPEPREESFFGWPGLDIFGAHLNSKHAVALGTATMFFGLWGFLTGTGVWVAYKSYRPGTPHRSFKGLLPRVLQSQPFVSQGNRAE